MLTDDLEQLIQADKEHLLHPMTPPHDIERLGAKFFVRGEGLYLVDAEGNRYIDAYSGMGNVILGHGHPDVVKAIKDQVDQLCYVPAFSRYGNPPAARLAKALTDIAPTGLNHAHFANSGSEANELSFKLARMYHDLTGNADKYKILSQDGAYHGVTYATMSAGGIPAYQQYFGPMMDGFAFVATPNTYRCDACAADDCKDHGPDDLERVILREGPDSVAAFIIEPVMGVGGHLVPGASYYPRVREICDRYNVLLIADEVVCGFGRTGTLFGLNHWDISPDLMSVAKGISSGYLPLGATVISDKAWAAILDAGEEYLFVHGHTTSAHPVCCAAGVATIEVIQRDGLVKNSKELGAYLLNRLQAGLADNPFAGDVRGLGLLASVELVQDPVTKEKFPVSDGVGKRAYQHIMDHGIIVRTANDIISLRPPLISTKKDIDEIVDVVVDAVDALETAKI